MLRASSSRFFSQSSIRRGLFAEYIKKIAPTVKEISVDELDKKVNADHSHGIPDTFHVIDVRETYEWNESHIPNAVYVGKGVIERDIESLVPDIYDQVVLYCASGKRSLLAADSLTKMGYKNVVSLKGGIAEWKKSEKPLIYSSASYGTRLEYGIKN